jgi:hypothetical protein
MEETRRKVYRAHMGVSVDSRNGYGTFSHYGYVTDCGRFVDGGSVMWPISAEWCDTEAEAEAKLAPKIAEIGARLIRQAAELLEAGKPVEVVGS